MKKQGKDLDSDKVEDIDDNMAQYMANPNRAGRVANDASLLENGDNNGYDLRV